MSDAGETIESFDILPKEVTKDVGTIKLFGRWDYVEVEVRDISLTYVDLGRMFQVGGQGRRIDC